MAEKSFKEGRVRWKSEGMKFEGTTHSGFRFPLDSQPEPGHEADAATPMQLVLVALAGCTGMDVVSILQKKRQPVTGLEVVTRGHQATNPPNVYTEIQIEYIVHGEGVEPEAVERSIELSEGKYCSVSAMLGKTAHITTSYRLEG